MNTKSEIIYLDNNATTMLDPSVFEKMQPFFSSYYTNPSSMYATSRFIRECINETRVKIARELNCAPSEIIFTSGATEANNAAIYAAIKNHPGKIHLITSDVEHPSVLNVMKNYENTGFKVTYIPVNSMGELDIDLLEKSISKETALVSIMYANNETGIINDIQQISSIVKGKGVLFHTDAVQAIGKEPIDLSNNYIDFLSLSGHKFHAPKGIGCLYINKNVKFSPFILGGHQEGSLRAGTENVTGIIGLGHAIEIACSTMKNTNEATLFLRDKFEIELSRRIPYMMINGKSAKRLTHVSNLSFQYIEGESILFMLEKQNIYVSTGSACSSDSLEPSHVLKAMNIPVEYINGSIRISLSKYTTQAEIEFAIEAICIVVERLRKLSPFCN